MREGPQPKHLHPNLQCCVDFAPIPTPIPIRQKSKAGNYALDSLQGKSSRQDRRRSDKYELNTENTNNPNTARARIITITSLPSKHPFILQPAVQLPLLPFQPLKSSRRNPL